MRSIDVVEAYLSVKDGLTQVVEILFDDGQHFFTKSVLKSSGPGDLSMDSC